MRKKKRSPQVYIIAGANGSGKTTFAREFLPNYVECLNFVNADLIAGGLSPFSPEGEAVRAGRLMLEQVQSLIRRKRDFGFETTLSGRTYLVLMRRLKKAGYRVNLFYLWIPSVELALTRIADRVKSGGHDIPTDIVHRRFRRSLQNFFHLYEPLMDSWTMFDNSGSLPRAVASKERGRLRVADRPLYEAILSKEGLI